MAASDNTGSNSSVESQSNGQASGLADAHQHRKKMWMEDKSQVLDEVDQLVDLMTEEKAALTKKIAELEEKLEEMGKKGSSLEEDREQLQAECETAKIQLKELQEKHSKESSNLREALAAAKKELKEVRKKVESLTSDLITEQDKRVKAISAHAELKRKLKYLQGEHKSVGAALEIQCRENVKVSEHCKTLTAENSLLQNKLETLQQKLKYSQDEVLALKGRLTSTKRSHDQLQVRYCELDKALNEATLSKSPTVIKVTSRSKEEMRLLTECKRKDGLIENYQEDLSTANKSKLKLQDQLRRLEQKLKTEQKEKQQLQSNCEEKRREWTSEVKSLQDRLSQCTAKLQAKEAKDEESCSSRERLQERLSQIEGELRASREELSTLREELKQRNKRSGKEIEHLEQEREKSKSMHQVNQQTISQLKSELESREVLHTKHVEELTDHWECQLREAKEDYQRLVTVSTKRCAELAREVWQLKAQLQEAVGGASEDKTTPTNQQQSLL